MGENNYLGMRKGDLDGKPYAKFWNPEMQPLQPQVLQAVNHGPEASELGFTMDEVDILAEPGYLPLENGRTRLRNGHFFVSVLTNMPGVTGEMIEWWMGWHYMEDQRYKLWHPRSHVSNGTLENRGDDPSVSDRDKYMTTHYVTEYIGDHRDDIAITFFPPDTFFTNTEKFAENGITATLCSRVDLQHAPLTIGYLVHQIREVEGGSEMRSRFWIGKPQLKGKKSSNPINKVLGSKFVTDRLGTPSIDRDLLVHCGMEMNHLAGFLPELYKEYHPDEKG